MYLATATGGPNCSSASSDAFACPRCGGRLRLLAAIESPKAIRATLDCLGLPARAPPLTPAQPQAAALEPGIEDLAPFDD